MRMIALMTSDVICVFMANTADTMDNHENLTDKKSKSQRKREMIALQELGEELVRLKTEQLAKLPLTDELREAIRAAQGMHARGARYRQMQYIGRLMREVDPAPVQEALDTLRNKQNRATALLHRLEKWRDELIAGDNEALEEVVAAFAAADRQQLRQLIRNAQKEKEAGKPPKSSRELFRYLRELQEAARATENREQTAEG
jgi:ribosome-associated protein